MALKVIGVRHHSPACAGLVKQTIRQMKPRFVLIEGPSDMNGRLDELLLGHEPPLAVFTFHQFEDHSHASWTPLCGYSPEWVGLNEGVACGADVRFMDLPAWTKSFEGVRNRYHDRRDEQRDLDGLLCQKFGVADVDSLWDHLFEQPMDLEELALRLESYFEALRGEAEASERDQPREDYMVRCLSWALAEAERSGGDVVAICGGFHAPFLSRNSRPDPALPSFPDPPRPEAGARHGSYLVPYSWKRLDSFTGYESGMPSPAFYDAVWTHGPEAAPEKLFETAVKRLRERKQPVSAADLIACFSLASALVRLRGHACMLRSDLLDGLAAGLVKDGLEAALPWTYRGVLRPRTDPMLVEIMAAFSGEKYGRLAAGTPRPPLLADVETELERCGVTLSSEPGAVALDLTEPLGREKSRVLHRLWILGIPGVERAKGSESAMGVELKETWGLKRTFETEMALIEAASWGATLEQAARARLEELLLAAEGKSSLLAEILGRAAFAGIQALSARVMDLVVASVEKETSLADLGSASSTLLSLWRHGDLYEMTGSAMIGAVLERSFERGLWLLEGLQGPAAPAVEGEIRAVASLRDLVRYGQGRIDTPAERAFGVMLRRAVDAEAPPAIRGAAIGFLWSTGGYESTGAAEVHALGGFRGVARVSSLGDFLSGLFILARDEVVRSNSLLESIDGTLSEMGPDDFLVALPSLRMAFAFFPPLEREGIARTVLEMHQGTATDSEARAFLRTQVPVEVVAEGAALELALDKLMKQYGLEAVKA